MIYKLSVGILLHKLHLNGRNKLPRSYIPILIVIQKMDSLHFIHHEHHYTGDKLKENLKDCYQLLNLKEGCTEEDLKKAFLKLAKTYHPDGGTSTSDAKKFSQVREAYLEIKAKIAQGDGAEKEEDIEKMVIFDIKHTAPQHRQYLTYEGVGSGTPSQRLKQYQQYKVMRSTENVYQHRLQKIAAEAENALVERDKQKARRNKISNTIERMVEDMIQESMSRGDFDNLPGSGKPLSYSDPNPFVDIATHNLNKILINNGYIPEWVTLEREIRNDIQRAREKLAVEAQKLGDPPFSPEISKTWNFHVDRFTEVIADVNVRVNKFNLIVPILTKQMVPYSVKREVKRVTENLKDYLPAGSESSCDVKPEQLTYQFSQKEQIHWREVWEHIKQVFRS
ncbi:hypothetical protein CHS0354_017439 [Potamilus streckersoni]|uniref:J domain-containing protein n=1 Tax=Potamilus streckersoni TaxID=2493646 RepID=A0AAE0SCE3_9BIVA|nr:hypothetical protein CHS0354_017439 [Potamilus streckersoni]